MSCFQCHQELYNLIIELYTSNRIEMLISFFAAIGPVLAILFSLYTYKQNQKNLDLNRILEKNSEMLKLSIEYPYFEDDDFCNLWDGNPENSEEKRRYYNYCCLVFNLIENLYNYSAKNINKMNNVLYFQEYVKTHRQWWKTEIPKSGGYPTDFINFINEIIAKG